MVLAFRCVGVGSLRVFCLRFVGDLCFSCCVASLACGFDFVGGFA